MRLSVLAAGVLALSTAFTGAVPATQGTEPCPPAKSTTKPGTSPATPQGMCIPEAGTPAPKASGGQSQSGSLFNVTTVSAQSQPSQKVTAAAQAEARTLNTAGYQLYKQGKYPEALEKFQRAVALDDTYAMAHYNVASTLGVLRKQKKVCEYDAYKSTILDHLERAVKLDPRRLVRMKVDEDLAPVHDTVRYQMLLGVSPERAGDLGRLLRVVSWYGAAQGAFGPQSGVDFGNNGKVTLWVLETGDAPKKNTVTGTYIIKGRTVILKLNKAVGGKKSLRGDVGVDGKVNLEAPVGPLTDNPSECSA